jgi:tetratricopeptide (TPR) repeat protein
VDSKPESRFGHLVLLGAAFFILFLLGIRTISGSDIWLHLAAGRHALEHGPAHIDPFSYVLPENTEWKQASWLYDILVYAVWSIGGSAVTIVLHALVVVAGFFLMVPTARRYGNDAVVAAALLFCAWLMAPLFTMRPALFTLLFVGIAVHLTNRSTLTPLHMGLLLINQIAWVNMAPAFLIGPLIVVVRAIELRRPVRPDEPAPAARPTSCLILAVALLAACLVNPFGHALVMDAFTALIQLKPAVTIEWISPFARDFLPYPLRFLTTTTLVLIAMVFIFYRDRLPMVPTTLAVLAAFQVVQSGHHVHLNALQVFPFIVISLVSIGRLAGGVMPGALRGLAIRIAPPLLGLLIVFSFWSIITNRYYVASGSASAFGLRVNTDAFPVAAADHLAALKKKPSRLINLSHDGGYLLWRMPGRRVFTDPRGELYGTDFFDVLSRGLVGHEESWKKLIATYDPDALLIHGTWTGAGPTAYRLLQGEQWAMAYFDGTSMLIVRTTSANREILDNTDARKQGLALIEASQDRYASNLDNRLVRPPNPSRLIGAASVFQALGRFDNALPFHRLLTVGSPRYVGAWVNQGIAEMQAGLPIKAITTLEHVTRLIPANPIGWLWLGNAYKAADRTSDAAASHDKARAINRIIAERFLSENTATNAPFP